jgi:hypothetical protein
MFSSEDVWLVTTSNLAVPADGLDGDIYRDVPSWSSSLSTLEAWHYAASRCFPARRHHLASLMRRHVRCEVALKPTGTTAAQAATLLHGVGRRRDNTKLSNIFVSEFLGEGDLIFSSPITHQTHLRAGNSLGAVLKTLPLLLLAKKSRSLPSWPVWR